MLKARKVKKGESGEGDEEGSLATSSRTYWSERNTDRTDVQSIKIKGRKKRWEDKKGSVRFEENVLSAEGEVDRRDRNPLGRYSAGTCPREDVKRNERCSSSSDSTGQI